MGTCMAVLWTTIDQYMNLPILSVRFLWSIFGKAKHILEKFEQTLLRKSLNGHER